MALTPHKTPARPSFAALQEQAQVAELQARLAVVTTHRNDLLGAFQQGQGGFPGPEPPTPGRFMDFDTPFGGFEPF